MSDVLNELKQLGTVFESLKNRVTTILNGQVGMTNNLSSQKIVESLQRLKITLERIETFDTKNEFSSRFYSNLFLGKLHVDRTLNSMQFEARNIADYGKNSYPEISSEVELISNIFMNFSKRFEAIQKILSQVLVPTFTGKNANEEYLEDIESKIHSYKNIPYVLDLMTESAKAFVNAAKTLNELKQNVKSILKGYMNDKGVDGICSIFDNLFAHFFNYRAIGTLNAHMNKLSNSLPHVLNVFKEDIMSLPKSSIRDALLFKYKEELTTYFKSLNSHTFDPEFFDKVEKNYLTIMLIHEIVLAYRYFLSNAMTDDVAKFGNLILEGNFSALSSFVKIFEKASSGAHIKRISMPKVA
ncbi:hypothetical protein JXM83_03410 [Candidatus Woesearchaeota archaeon]|nr:hypothetical protein [Candidatus Woesearchaeota archaeon]